VNDHRLAESAAAHIQTWRPYTLWYAGLVGLAGAGLASDRTGYLRLVAAWLVPTLIWLSAHYLGDYLDRELDSISKPHRPIPSGRIRPSTALGCGAVLAAAAVAIAVSVNWLTVFLLAAGVGGVLAYNGFFKARGLWGNLVRGALTGVAFVFGQLMAVPHPVVALLPFALVFASHDAASNLVGTLRDVEGDSAGGYITFAVRHGVRMATWTAAGLYCVSIATAVTGLLVIAPHGKAATLVAILVSAGLGTYAFGTLLRPGRPLTPRIALQSHKVLVVERVILAGGLAVAGVGVPIAIAIVTVALAITISTQRAMRSRYEFTLPTAKTPSAVETGGKSARRAAMPAPELTDLTEAEGGGFP